MNIVRFRVNLLPTTDEGYAPHRESFFSKKKMALQTGIRNRRFRKMDRS